MGQNKSIRFDEHFFQFYSIKIDDEYTVRILKIQF